MSVKAILTEQQKSYTKAEENALLAQKAAKENGIYFGSCTTAANVSAKTASISSLTNYYHRLQVRINFVYGQQASSPTLNINNLGAWPLSMHQQNSGIFDFILNVTAADQEHGITEAQWEMVNDGIANAYGNYGKTTLSDDMSTNDETAATPNAIKKAYDVLDTAIDTINNSKVSANGLGKNLIRNWYFEGLGNGRGKFPINSRQIASGTNQTSGRWIDCWKGSMPTGINWSFTTSGLSIANTKTGNYVYPQVLDNPNDILLGKQVTLSLLTTTGFYTATGYILSSYPSSSEGAIGGVQVGPTGQAYALLYMYPDRIEARFRIPEGVSYIIRAIKLELGDTQTLCHNEGTDNSPIWILNEFPDYEYELYRCQTATIDSTDTFANQVISTNVSNENLLPNWYFMESESRGGKLPINSRGLYEVNSAQAFLMDRWCILDGAGVASYSKFGLNLTATTNFLRFCTQIPLWRIENKQITLSVLITNITDGEVTVFLGESGGNIINNFTPPGMNGISATSPGLYSVTGVPVHNSSGTKNDLCNVIIRVSQGANATITAIKLEYGSQSTLAHLENDEWVVNEIPDYNDEYIKCITDSGQSLDTYANKTLATTANIPQAATATPLTDGTAAVGTSTKWAREDHVHGTDTSRAPTSHASSATTYGVGNSSNYGHVKLSDSTSSSSDTGSAIAATPKAVKTAYDLANGAIPKSIGTAAGDIIYWSASGTPARLAKGTNGQVLKLSNGVPTWSADNNSVTGVKGDSETSYRTGQVSLTAANVGAAPTNHASSTTTYGKGNGTNYGHVKLSNDTSTQSGTADGIAATPYAVKLVNDAKAPNNHASSATTYGTGTDANYGHVKLYDGVDSTSGATSAIAATPKAVKTAYDLANGKAPTSHASSATTYGVGNNTNYGHVKLSGDIDSSSGVDGGVALTPRALQKLREISNNLNLLDNWYFVGGGGLTQFPINQQGLSTYGNGTITIDRWWNYNSGSVKVLNNAVRIAGNGSSGAALVRQMLPDYLTAALLGKTVTLSIYSTVTTSGGYIQMTAGPNPNTGSLPNYGSQAIVSGITTKTITLPTEITDGYSFMFQMSAGGTASYDVYAVKLELGDKQTLAHQENGVWILNEIPSYQQELAKCQRYLQILNTEKVNYAHFGMGVATNTTTCYVQVPLTVPMYKAPTITKQGTLVLNPGNATTRVTVTSVTGETGSKMQNNICVVEATVASGLTSEKLYFLGAYNDTTARLILTANPW